MNPEHVSDTLVAQRERPVRSADLSAQVRKIRGRVKGQMVPRPIQNHDSTHIDLEASLRSVVGTHRSTDLDSVIELDVQVAKEVGCRDALRFARAVFDNDESGPGENAKPVHPPADHDRSIWYGPQC